MINSSPYSIYIHIPFCQQRCGYCDFNTYAGLDSLIPQYVKALCVEFEHSRASSEAPLAVKTIFFGGGTPSLLSDSQLESLLIALDTSFDLQPGAEITLEANPGTLTFEKLRRLRQMGINRLSIGMQSANPDELRILERTHSYLDVIQAVTWARKAGFDNLNLDLIFGIPGGTMARWRKSLDLALGMRPEHLALYCLTLENGTPFGRWAKRGLISVPDSDQAAVMYEWAAEKLIKYGYTQYEISNWAVSNPKSPHETPFCHHNLQYWRNLPYLGFGAGAHGYAGGKRLNNLLSPAAYIQRLVPSRDLDPSSSFPETPATQSIYSIDQRTEMGETMMMGLRLTKEGVSAKGFEQRFNQPLVQVFGHQIERLISLGLLEWAGDGLAERLRLAPKGRLLGNQVFMEFL